MCNCSAIHLRVMVVSTRRRLAILTLRRSHLRFVATAEEVAKVLVAAVEARRVGAEKPFHAGNEVGAGRFDDEMEMIAHQAVGVDLPGGFFRGLRRGF